MHYMAGVQNNKKWEEEEEQRGENRQRKLQCLLWDLNLHLVACGWQVSVHFAAAGNQALASKRWFIVTMSVRKGF